MSIQAEMNRTERLLFEWQTKIFTVLWFVVVLLGLVGILILFGEYGKLIDLPHRFVVWLHLDREVNIPSAFSSGLFLFNSALFYLIGSKYRSRKRDSWTLILFSAVFLFLSYDEFFEFHESIKWPLRSFITFIPIPYFTWMAPYILALSLLVYLAIPFLKNLKSHYARQLVFAGAVFCAGSIAVELVESWYYETYFASGLQKKSLTYDIMASIEELLELSGLVLSASCLVKIYTSEDAFVH